MGVMLRGKFCNRHARKVGDFGVLSAQSLVIRGLAGWQPMRDRYKVIDNP